MGDSVRRRALFFAGLALVALLLLAAGLSGLELRPGLPLGGPQPPAEEETGDRFLSGEVMDTVLVILAILTILLLPVAVLYALSSSDLRRRVWRLLGAGIWLVILALLARARPAPQPGQQPPGPATPPPTATLPAGSPAGAAGPALDLVANPPAWLVWLTAGLLALLAVGLVAGVAWLIWFRARQEPGALQELGGPVQEAIGRLAAGAEVSNTILRCYFTMSRILDEQRGLTRAEAMTPREFERQLAGLGLPDVPVAQLTRLFEQARYGSAAPDEGQERRAMDCLAAIARAIEGAP